MNPEVKAKKERIVYTAHQRAQAVLSVWTERRRPSEVCHELGINTILLAQWQERALAGMLSALEPRCRPETQRGTALSERLERLLARQSLVQEGKQVKLERRLTKLQQEPSSSPPPKEK